MEEKEIIRERADNTAQIVCGIMFVFCVGMVIKNMIDLWHVNQINEASNILNNTWTVTRYHPLKSIWPDIITIVCFVILAVLSVYYFLFSRNNEIVVTDKRVYGVAGFGKRVDIPVDSITSIGTKFYKAVIVASSSGQIVFAGLPNVDEVHKTLSDLIVYRQNKKAEDKTDMDETVKLREYKNLMDEGLITSDEYEEKKKQLLDI